MTVEQSRASHVKRSFIEQWTLNHEDRHVSIKYLYPETASDHIFVDIDHLAGFVP